MLLFHFDRSGNHCYSMPHCNAFAFVKIILGLSSLDEEVLGLDTSIQWTIDPMTGGKMGGTLTVADDESKTSKTYELASLYPVFRQYCITGRATICWDLYDEENDRILLAKDCYRFSVDSREPEFESLKTAQGLDGVAQMVAYTAHLWGTLQDYGYSRYRDARGRKIASRIVVEKYGEDLLGFKSEKQLLYAIRDSIAGAFFYSVAFSSTILRHPLILQVTGIY